MNGLFNEKKKVSVTDQVMEYIINGIQSGKYVIGEKLPNEFVLVEELNVSRTSLRESVKILCALGVLEIRRGDGTYVCSQINPTKLDKIVYSMISMISSDEDIRELRRMLDETILRNAILKADKEDIAKLKENIEEMKVFLEINDIEKAIECDYNFHMILIDACKNDFFSKITKGVYFIYVRSMYSTMEQEKIESNSIAYHQKMLDCIKNRDNSSVEEVIKLSLNEWKRN